jgi:hypothetical protein
LTFCIFPPGGRSVKVVKPSPGGGCGAVFPWGACQKACVCRGFEKCETVSHFPRGHRKFNAETQRTQRNAEEGKGLFQRADGRSISSRRIAKRTPTQTTSIYFPIYFSLCALTSSSLKSRNALCSSGDNSRHSQAIGTATSASQRRNSSFEWRGD